EPVILSQQSIRALPDGWGSIGIKKVVNIKIAFELEMGPMEERVAQSVGNGGRPSHEFLVGRSVARAEPFGYAVGPHCPPFIVVSLKPNIDQVGKTAVFYNLLG